MQLQPDELGVSVRDAMLADASRIVTLASQLGYEVPLQHVEAILRSPEGDRAIMVAVVPRAGVVGWVVVAQHDTLISSRRAEVEGLVVEDEFRGNRIGALLVESAEDWARKRGCSTLRLLSNVVRERAHTFYTRLGYEVLKSQYVFQKNL